MKIAFVTPSYYPSIIGVSFYCQELAAYLTKKGHSVTVYTKANPGWKTEDTLGDVEIKRIPVRHILSGRFYFSSKMVTDVAREKFDIIHSHHYGYFPAFAGLLAAKIRKTPHVFGPYYHPPVYSFARSLQFAIYHYTQGLPLLRFSDKVLPHTEYERKMLLKIGADKSKLELLPNIVDVNAFQPKEPKKEELILFVSNLIKDKGVDVAFMIAEKILAKRKNARAVFIGNPYDANMLDIITRAKKNKKIKILPNVSLEELVKWYSRASVVILPSKYEAFSRVLAEAQACETPVVATKVGGVPEVVKHEKTGFLVDYGEWEKMQSYVEQLLDDKTFARTMGKAGRKHVKDNFDIGIIGSRLWKIYESLL